MKLAIILIHGIGPTKEGWAEDIIKELKKKTACQINKLLTDAKAPDINEILEVRSVYWKDVFKKREDELNEILDQQIHVREVKASILIRIGRILIKKFRELQNKIITDFIGDIIGYGNEAAQREVYDRIANALNEAAQKSAAVSGKIPLSIIAHSLGTVIVSDFIYNRRKERQIKGETGFDSRFCLYNLFTVGSPIALFSLRFGRPAAFNKPIHVEADRGRWLNIYDTDDPIGMPLKPLNDAYAEAVFKDVKVEAGMYGLSHTKYFNNSKTLDMISYKIAMDWIALNKKLPQESTDKLYREYDDTLCVK